MNDAIMNTATIRNLRAATLTATIGESRCGLHQPQVDVRFPKGTHYRKAKAALHALASILELATPHNEGWIVQMDSRSDDHGRIYLELANGTVGEARRGLEFLQRAIA
jgi:hypothetical protein